MGVRVSRDRLMRRLFALGEVGAIDGGGCARLALTDADRDGRDIVTAWMRDLGLDVTIDLVGNVIGVWRDGALDASLAPVMCGSHIDTVATGGIYDGNLGVLAGLEVIEACQLAGYRPERPLAVGYFTDEEGARFAPDMLGSLVYVGGMTAEEAHDATDAAGVRVVDELARIGYLGPTPCPGPVPHAFVELHIEQGPVLEDAGVRIGAVTGVQGISWQELTISGRSSHAGTTPMRLRRDPLAAAARLAVFVNDLVREVGGAQVGTVGKLSVHPNLVNVVASRVVMTVDLRNTDELVLQDCERRFADAVSAAETEFGVSISTRSLARFEPVEFDARVIDLVARTAARYVDPVMHLPSGAGHDAQMFARVCPTAMIFTPSANGLSHNPAEFTEPDDLVVGCQILADVMLDLARTDFV
jgi:beta-ureidopropionase / N-carbamoyl-L-amino-acid hydrolase